MNIGFSPIKYNIQQSFSINYLIKIILFIFFIIVIIQLFIIKPVDNVFHIVYDLNYHNKLLNNKIKIDTHILPRNDIPILNKHELISDNIGDYHYVIYYLSNNYCKIIIRRLDNYEINSNILIKIYDTNSFDTIRFLPTKNNEIIKIVKVNVNLNKVIYKDTIIPKIIVQTNKTNIINMAEYNAIRTFIELNPEYTYIYIDDINCINILKQHFNKDVIDAYNKIIPGAFKADLFRYCFLYIFGGCYFDIKQINRVPLRDFIDEKQTICLCNDIQDKHYYNALMCSTKLHYIMKQCIDQCVYNIKNDFYGKTPLDPTGPRLLYNIAKHIEPTLYHRFKFIYFISNIRHKGDIYSYKLNKVVCNSAYKGYYKSVIPNNSYTMLWFNKQIYLKDN